MRSDSASIFFQYSGELRVVRELVVVADVEAEELLRRRDALSDRAWAATASNIAAATSARAGWRRGNELARRRRDADSVRFTMQVLACYEGGWATGVEMNGPKDNRLQEDTRAPGRWPAGPVRGGGPPSPNRSDMPPRLARFLHDPAADRDGRKGMRVLVTGGTGVVGVAAVNGLLARGHPVRLLCRHADRDVAQWSRNVQPFVGDITNASITGSADDCDAVLHLAGIIEETPPERTYERVNVHGTRNTVKEAARARVKSFVYVSSLGAQRGRSAYHRSKLGGETIVSAFPGEWRIVRLGNVYGPGDTVISVLLRTIRMVPVVPTIDGGRVEFQPIWHHDAGEALAAIVEGGGGSCPIVEVTGPERTSMADLLDQLGELTGRRPPRVPVPAFLADIAVHAAEAAGLKLPLRSASLTMLLEHNVIDDPSLNALPQLLDHPPTPLHWTD